MNNIQKNFKAKRGLCMAQGGLIDQLDPSGKMSRMDLGALTNDPTVLNAAMDREGLAAEQARQAKYPGQAFMNPVAQPQRQAAPQQAAQLQPQQPLDRLREPAPTSFEEDNDARGLRIQGYGDQLASMRKERLGLADGTANIAQAAQPESAEQVMARMAAKYGVSAQPTTAPVQAPQPVQQAPAPQRQGLMGAAMGLLGGRKAAIDRATGYAEGGIVRGKGGPTDDEVPMQVAGKDVNLSNSEAVLPVKTVHALGGPEAVEELIEETNGKPPVRGGLRAGGAYADGLPGTPQEAWAEHQSRQAAATAEKQALAQTAARAEATGAALAGDVANTEAAAATLRPTPPAPKPIGLGGRAMGALRAFATNPAMAIPTGVMATKAAADFVDSFPSLRGRATAEASNMELAGTPQHDAEVNSALVAKDAAWEQRHGKTLSDAQRTPQDPRALHAANMVDGPGTGTFEMPEFDTRGGDKELRAARKNGRFSTVDESAATDLAAATKAGNFAGQNHIPEAVTPADRVVADSLGGVVDKATGVSRSGDGGLRGMAKRLDTYAKNDDVRGARNMREQLMGSGARFDKGSDGKITVTNRGDFDGSTKMAYTGADGNPTAVHEGSQQHMQGLKDAQGLRNQLANFEQMNLKRNAQDDITDIGLRNSSRAALASQAASQAELNKALIAKQPSALDLEKHQLEKQKFQHDLAKTNNLQGNSDRDAASAKQEKRLARYKQLLDMHAPTDGLKDADLLSAQARRADLQRAFETASTGLKLQGMNDVDHDTGVNQAVNQARLSVAVQQAMRKDKAGWNFNNVGKKANTTLGVGGLPAYSYDENSDTLDIGGYKVKGKDVWGDDADLQAFAKTRKTK